MREYKAGPNEEGMRLSRFVLRVTTGLPPGQMHKAFRNRRVKVNGRRAAPEDRLQQGDRVELYLNDEFFSPENAPGHVPAPGPASRQWPPFSILWENQDLAILHKPAGVLSHSDDAGHPGLAEAFAHHLAQTGAHDPGKEFTFTPALANRLDRNTEGLVLAAKAYPALRDAGALLRAGLVEKRYLCVTRGLPPQGRHDAWLLRDRTRHRAAVQKTERPGTKPVSTGVRVLEQKNGYALCEIILYTGRTHQIRAHLAALGAPLLGDAKYGGGAGGQALCAYRLAFGSDISEDNRLHLLAGQVFELKENDVTRLWAAL